MEDPKLTPEEELRIENEIKALDLEVTYGATNFISDDTPPELTKMFLDNVARFEAAYADAKQVPIRAFAKIPDPTPEAQVADEDLEGHIQALLEQLEAASVTIDRPEHLAPRDYYRFLTEVFLQEEMMDCTVPGMMHGFLYSEFCHDGPEFILEHVEETLLDLLNLGRDFQGDWIGETCRTQTEVITRQEALERIHIFRSQYKEIKPLGFRPEETIASDPFRYLTFAIAWEGTPLRGGEPVLHEGLGISQVGWEGSEWVVQGLMIPGFEF